MMKVQLVIRAQMKAVTLKKPAQRIGHLQMRAQQTVAVSPPFRVVTPMVARSSVLLTMASGGRLPIGVAMLGTAYCIMVALKWPVAWILSRMASPYGV